MRPESEQEFLELIQLLDSPKPRNAKGEPVRRADYIHRLLYYDVVQAVRYAASFYLSEDRAERQAAAFVVQGALPHFSGKDIQRFSSQTWWRSWPHCGDWKRLSSSMLRKFDIRPDRGLFQLATLHPNGYIRQAALDSLAAKPLPSDWPFVLVRLTDWVSAVANSAERLLNSMLVPENWEALMRHGHLIASLSHSRRMSAVRSLPRIIEFLERDPRFIDRWARLPVNFRRVATQYLHLDERMWATLTSFLRHDGDLYVNRMAVSMAAATGDSETLKKLNASPIPQIRVLTLEALIELLPDEAGDVLAASLMDKAWPIRNAARYHLDRRGGMDYRAHYIAALPAPGAIAGLGDVGRSEDAVLLEPYLESPDRHSRLFALRGILNLDSSLLATHAGDLIRDPNRHVRQLAIEFLSENQEMVSVEERLRLFQSNDPVERRTGAKLLFRIAHWESGFWILTACGDPEPEMRRLAVAALRLWIRRSFVWPSPTKAQREKVETVRVYCPSAMAEELRLALAAVDARL